MWSTLSLPLFLDLLSLGVVVPIRVPSMGHIEIDNHFLNLKPFGYVQTNGHWLVLKFYLQTIRLQILYIQFISMNNIWHYITYKGWNAIKHTQVTIIKDSLHSQDVQFMEALFHHGCFHVNLCDTIKMNPWLTLWKPTTCVLVLGILTDDNPQYLSDLAPCLSDCDIL